MSSEINPDSNVVAHASGSSSIEQPASQATPSDTSFKYFRAPGSNAATRLGDLPESYFVPSAADLRAQQNSLIARTQALSNAPLKTQAMRDAEEKAKRTKYPTTTIRIKFSDRSQLQKSFPSTDKIRSVYAFVRSSLREDVKPIKFVLYQPPKRELKVSDTAVRDLSLLQLDLAPSSVLHLRFLDDSLNDPTTPAPLDASIIARAEDLPIPPDPDKDTSPGSSRVQTPRPKASSSSTSGKTDIKVPKWFKIGQSTSIPLTHATVMLTKVQTITEK
ncbi:hypothetical protein NLI96_g9694 [Meripilus lineatus]|uniref:UBX domain-containing protein n=1 Tax=Meripilus lineatus TaxID=2056292 RepID=A0AAD5UV01_9APHY|nr:hypothetical protein NLI96_g9694 [Physisporinus lineatus]